MAIDKDFLDKVKAVMIGHAIGDALGVPVEFLSRERLSESPLTDMKGYGTFSMPKGSWSDDTSMSLCALETFGGKKLDFDSVMLNFSRWYYKGEFTPTGEVFDVGNICSIAIERYLEKNIPWTKCGLNGEKSNGNGSLMRIHPFVLYTYRLDADVKIKIKIIELASALTHAHACSKTACGIYAFILWELLSEPVKKSINTGLFKAKKHYADNPETARFKKLFSEDFAAIKENEIASGGYVVDTLEAAVWCLLTTDNYRDCVLKAVNLGNDTDTVGAVAGGLSGALYGYDGIPDKWKNDLLKREYIENLCEKFVVNTDEKHWKSVR